MEHRRVCFCMLSLLPLVQISKLSQANSLLFGKVCCRTPRGVRGLKSLLLLHSAYKAPSHPSRGAWIEILIAALLFANVLCRTPRGVRGLKFCPALSRARGCSRTPRGVRGLKSPMESSRGQIYLVSHPSRGAWIEIAHGLCAPDHRHSRTPRGVRGLKWNYYDYVDTLRGRTPRGVRGLKSCVVECGPSGRLSHPSRGAWIEIRPP